MPSEAIGVLNNPNPSSPALTPGRSWEEVAPEVALPRKQPMASVLGFSSALGLLQAYVVAQAEPTELESQVEVLQSSFKPEGVSDVFLVRHLASAAQVEKILQDTNARLDELLHLGRDWYVHGAEEISGDAVRRAKDLVARLSEWHHGTFGERIKPHGVAPLVSGGVELVWRGSRGWLEILVSPSGTLEYVEEAGQGADVHYEDGDVSVEQVPALLNRIL